MISTSKQKQNTDTVRASRPADQTNGFNRRESSYVPPPYRRSRLVIAMAAAAMIGILVVGYFLLDRPAKPAPLKAAHSTPTAVPHAGDITATSATISWATDQASTSQVEFGTTPTYGSLSAFDPAPVTNHLIRLTGLTPGTTYNYVVLSTAPAGNVDKSSNYTFQTLGTNGTPVINGVEVKDLTTTSATIAWTTDQPVTSQVEYGDSTSYGFLSAFNSSPVTTHSVVLTGLTPGTTYNYAVLSTSSTGKVSASPNAVFTTAKLAGPATISQAAAVKITTTTANITWSTDQPSTSQVQYGTTPAYGSLSAFDSAPVTAHSLLLQGLTPGTTYNFLALSANSNGQVGTSANATFTTASGASAPTIGNAKADGITTTSATITWTTDQPSASQVQYGTTTSYGFLSAYNAALVTTHSVTLSGLIPGTTYNYTALSANSAGQVGKSANATFSAGAGPPVIGHVAASGITGTSAIITWSTEQPSTSEVEYGATDLFARLLHRHRRPYNSQSPVNASMVKAHSITLSGLTPNTTYNFAVSSRNASGLQNLSPNQKFTTR